MDAPLSRDYANRSGPHEDGRDFVTIYLQLICLMETSWAAWYWRVCAYLHHADLSGREWLSISSTSRYRTNLINLDDRVTISRVEFVSHPCSETYLSGWIGGHRYKLQPLSHLRRSSVLPFYPGRSASRGTCTHRRRRD